MVNILVKVQRADESWPLFESEDPELVRRVVEAILDRLGAPRREPAALRKLRSEVPSDGAG